MKDSPVMDNRLKDEGDSVALKDWLVYQEK